MNYTGESWPSPANPGSIASAAASLDSLPGAVTTFTVGDAELLFAGNFERHGRDLIISDQTHHLVVPNYFSGGKRPLLVSAEGAPLDPAVVDALTGHIQYAQAGSTSAAKLVGNIVKMTGSASIVRNGVAIDVQVGDVVYQSDVLQTGSTSTIGLVLVDGTAFNLSANTRLMLNDLTFDASSTSNSSLITLVQGAASFVAGQVAKTGDMKVATPTAAIGIRGTAVKLDIASTNGRVDISVIDQRDGQVHSVEVFNNAGDQIATVTSNGPSLSVTPTSNLDVVIQQNNKTPAQIAQEFGTYQAAIDTYNVQKQINPNLPQHTENTGGDNANTGQTRSASVGSTPADPPTTAPFVELTSLTTQVESSEPIPSTGLIATLGSNSANGTTTSITSNTTADSPAPLLLKPAAPTVTANLTAVTGPSSSGNITSNSELNGTGLANTIVNFTIDGTPIASTVSADAQGRWSFQPIGLADGTHTIVASQTDTFGNTGTASLSFTLDTVAPSGGTPSLVAGSDTGSVRTDNITAATAPTFAVLLNPSVVAGDTVELLLAGSPLAHPVTHVITASDVMAGSVGLTVVSGDLGADGPKQMTAQFRDTAGNSSMGLAQNFTLDTTAPLVVITSAGGLASQTQTVTGTVDFTDAGATVTIFNGANPIGSATVQSDGTWSSSVILNNGNNALTARVADAAGNVGISNSVIYAIDDAPVATPVTLAAGNEDTAYTITAATLLAGVTDVDGPALSITSVGVASGGGSIVNNGNGTWTYTPAPNFSGPVSFSYTASDGSLSASSTASLTIKPATALAITAITTDSGTAGDFITNDTTLTVSGTNGVLGVGEKIQVSSNGGATWTDVIQNGTNWSLADAVTHPASFTYQARIIDSAGNIGTTANQPVTIDTSAPAAALAITAITTDSGTLGDFITNDTTLTVSGTNGVLGAGEKIQVSSNGGVTWTDVIQNGTTWSLADAVTHPASFNYQARIIDSAGNIGTTASQAITIDTSAPAAALAITAIAGSSSPNVTSVTISGSNGALANGDKLQISSDGGATWTDVVQNTAASWNFVDNVVHTADYTYRTRIVDSAGNVGVVTVPQLVRVANNGATVSVGGSSALVTGTAGGTLQLSPGITATVNVISIASGPVVITGGSSVTTAVGNAIDLSATGGTQAAPANLSVNLTGPITGAASGVNAVQNASGSITITTSGPVVGQAGQGISVQHSATGVGNILVNGSGNVTGTGAGFSGILAQNLDTANNGNVTVSQTGNISGGRDGIRAQTNGDGNVSVTTGSNATITGSLLYGIEAVSNGRGSISVATATGDTINSGSVGINVYNQATSIPQVSGLTASIISVTANGTINSGTTYTGSGARPAGILAGYKGGTTNTSNATAFGNVTVDNFANINAAGGDGIRAYNFGPGNVTVNNHGGTIVAKDMFGITASSNSTGKVSITMEAGAVINSGSSAIQAINLAATVPVGAQSTVSVTAAGTIHSGYHLTPGGAQPQAISVGYFPGNSGVSNTNVNGTVFVDNFANVIADAGTGVNAYNYGNGSVTLINEANTSVYGAQYGITAFSSSSGTGSVTINVGSNAAITAGSLYGLSGILGGINNSGNVSITTSAGDVINSGGTGIQANSSANSAASSQISVTTLGGTINSGFNSNGNQSGGIWAGYNPAGQGLVNSNVHGNVTVDNAANINAASGVGIGLYNFGVGNLSATIRPTSTVSAISAGVNAFAQGGGSVSIVNQGVIIANSGAGITVGTGTGTPNSVSGLISINNSGAITSLGSSANPTIQINNASTQAAILTNSGTITANLFGKAASSLAVAGYNGSIAITNTGTISGNFSLASATVNNAASGIWRVSGTNFLGSAASITNSGLIAVSGQSYFNAAVLFALANSGTIDLQANSTAVVGANVTGAGNFNIGDRSMLELGGAVAAGQTISFTAGVRGVLRLDSPSNFQGSISGLANGDLIDLVGVTISSASISATTLTVTKADTTTLTYQVTSVQPNTMLNVLASDKIVVVPTTAVAITGQSTPYSSSPSSSQAYIFANDAIVAPTVATSGININASLATNPTDTIFVNINQTSSVSLPAPASGSGATPAGVNITTGGASIVLMNAGNISLAGNVNATGGSGIFTNSLTGSTDVINYGNVSGNNVGISARTSGTGLLNIVVGNSATVTGITSHGIVAISTLGAERVTTLSGATINSNAVGILAQNQGTSVPQGVLTGSNSSISISTSFGTINAGTHGISAGYLTNATTPATIPDPPNTSVYGDINIDNNATITARAGVGILAYNYGVGNIAVSNAGTITATAAGTTIPGTTQTQYGISAFNYGSGSTVVTTGPGSSITSGGAGLNVGNQAAAVAAAAASTVTVVALGSIQSGSNTNNSGSAPAGILAGFNPKNAGVFNGNVFGDVFVSAGGNITAAAGDGIQAYNYGIGNISVNVGFNVNIQALTSSTASSGNAPYGIGAFNYGPGDIHVTTSTGDVINSGSSGINASNQSTSIAANQDAMVTVSAAGSIHSRAINNNSGALPSGITAGFLGGTSSTPNLNVNGTVIVNNAANVTADAGYGISAYNYGNGDITINSGAGTTVTGAVNGIYAHAEAVGATGNIAVTLYNNVTVNSTSSYGIQASSNNNGNISVVTNAGDVINSGSNGINAVNLSPSIDASYRSSIVVTAAGTINSGTALTGTGNQPSGISAGYLGPAPGGVVTTTFPLTAINGDVVVNNFANINAAGGDGIRAYNYGIGDIFVNDLAGTINALNVGNSTPGFGIGIAALNYGSGDIRVSTAAGTAINSASSGIAAVNKAPSTPGFVVPSTSEISVLAFGTIHSGQIPTATAANDPPAGILAGYNPNNSNVPDSNIHGNVSIDNYATILAPAGTDGIRGVNYGTGDVTIIVESGANISAGRYGVAALGYNGGNVSITNFGLVTGPTYAVNAATTSSGKSVIDNFGHLVGNATGYNATFTNEIGGDWSLNGSSVFTGASTLLNSGLIDSNGVSTISGFLTIINTGTFEVQSGILTVGGPMTGAGNVVIYGATMEFTAASDANVQFSSAAIGTLVLDDVSHFTGTVTGFSFGDTIDLKGISPANVFVTNSGHLQINYGAGSFELIGNYDLTGFTIASDGGTGTNITWNHQAPVILTNNLTTVANPDGTLKVLGLQVADIDQSASSEIFHFAATTEAAPGTGLTPSSDSGSLTQINSLLASGVTYQPGGSPPAVDMINLTVTDSFGASDNVHFVFNQVGSAPNSTLQGTSGKDVIFATNSQDVLIGGAGQDQFLFAPTSSGPTVQHTITDFEVGIDKLDVRQFSGLTPSSLSGAIQQQGSDTLINLDAHDTLLLKNVFAANVHASDFIVHS